MHQLHQLHLFFKTFCFVYSYAVYIYYRTTDSGVVGSIEKPSRKGVHIGVSKDLDQWGKITKK